MSGSKSVRWIHETKVDGVITFRRGMRGDRMIADWPGFARLTCARDGSDARLVPAPGVSRRAVDGLRGAPVNALLHDLGGRLALHSSAVAIDGRAVMFLGDSGTGKSTAAAEMVLREGACMLADDAALLEIGAGEILVLPGDRRHWLTRESCMALGVPAPDGGDKQALRARHVAAEPCPLALVVALSLAPDRPHTAARPIRGGDAARALLAAVIRFDVEDSVARRREFQQVTTVYERTPFLGLERRTGAPGFIAPFVLDALRRGS